MKDSFGLGFTFLLIAFLLMVYTAHKERGERRAVEKILAQEVKDHAHTRAILDATVEECGDAWLKEPVSKKLKARLPK